VGRFQKGNTAVTTPQTFADVRANITNSNPSGGAEDGLFAIAFHPDWPTIEEVFLSYTAGSYGNSTATNRVSRFTLAGDGTVDETSEEILLDIPDFANNHNGGMIAFGQDGFLYVGMGDGGFGNDPNEYGQDPQALLGKMLRIDVDNATNGNNYAIPGDNPFVDDAAYAPEIYALGLRNPWRWSFDRATDELWLGDVGQFEWEEVNVIVSGGNYGWDVFEAVECVQDTSGPSGPCDLGGTIDPVAFYGHTNGRVAITGGYVYRGTDVPALVGRYLFADHSSTEVFTLEDDGTGRFVVAGLSGGSTGINVAGFGEDAEGELYVMSVFANTVHKIGPSGPPVVDTFPQLLSETGCMDANDTRLPGPGLIPFDVNAPLYSDGADKERFVALPDGTTATMDAADGDIDLPNGTVLIKHFRVADQLVETRLFMRHDDSQWRGYSYKWNDTQTDAQLLPAADAVDVNGQTWNFPSRTACLTCHTAAAGRSLGVESAQLNGDYTYAQTGRTANQLVTWASIGVLTLPAPVTQLPRAERYNGAAPIEERARAYLHGNCSHCHRPNGGALGNMDLRLLTSFANTNTCDVTPGEDDFGVANARLVAAGDPGRSMMSVRMHRLGAGQMPPLGRAIVDAEGTGLIDGWITALAGCP
jgi:uncharacterized repeat protein (TIGR03806 family)